MERRSLVPELVVSDFGKSHRFYVSDLGFSVKYTRADPPFAYLEFEGSQIMLEEVRPDSWLIGELEHPFGRGINLQIECTNVVKMRERVEAAGIAVFVDLYDAKYEAADALINQRQFLVADPDGYLLRFSQRTDERKHKI